MTDERCVICGEVIPEGRQICPNCEPRQAVKQRRAGTPQRLKVYVCSPYSGDVKRNTKYAQELTKWALYRGYVPITPHLYIPQVLNDDNPDERALGIDVGRALLQSCDLVLVGGQYGISAGMAGEIREALRLCIPIKHI